MRSSRYYQTAAQIVGSTSEIVLFLSGFYLGKAMFIIAAVLLALRIANKIAVSELLYKRLKATVKEESRMATTTTCKRCGCETHSTRISAVDYAYICRQCKREEEGSGEYERD